MFNKSFLFFLSFIAFCWIGYVGFILLQGSNNPPKPETCFSQADGTIIVIHKPLEIDFTDSTMLPLQKSQFLMQLINQPERIQHYYLNEQLNKVLLERSKPWSVDLIHTYFNAQNISVDIASDKSFKLSNDWHGTFHGKYLLLTNKTHEIATSIQRGWNYIDQKSSYSLITFKGKSFSLKNIYLINNQRTSYFTSSNQKSFPLVDDQELFQELIPNTVENYSFYQKEWAQSMNDPKNIAFEWMDYGMALIVSKKDTCFISDIKSGQDPIAILLDVPGFDPKSAHQGTLSKTAIPFLKFGKFHVEVFNNAVFISKSSNLINQIIGAYETGNTLAQAHTKRSQLFANMPKKVNFRHFTTSFHETKSYMSGAVCRFVQGSQTETSNPEQTNVNPFNPLRLDGNLVFVTEIPGSDRLLVTTSANTLYVIGKNRIEWSKTCDGTIQSKPVYVGSTIYLATSSGIEGLQMNGENRPNFPIALGMVQSNLFEYVWKGQTYLGFATSNEISAINLDGKVQFKLQAGNKVITEVAVQGKKGELLVHAVGPNNWQLFNVNRKIRTKEFRITEGTWRLNKVNQDISIIGVSKNKLIRINEQNQQSMLIGNCSKLLRVQTFQNDRIQIAIQDKTAYLVRSNGSLLSQFTTNLNEIEDAALFTLSNGKTIVGIIDGISNNCYIYKINGNELNKENYEGSNRIVFQRLIDGTVVLVSQSNGYLIRYPLIF